MTTIRHIYDYFGWPLAPNVEKRIRNSLAKQPPAQNGFHRYRASQFGLETMDRERDFGAYCNRFGLSRHATSESTPHANALVSK